MAETEKQLCHSVAGPLEIGDDDITSMTAAIWTAWTILSARYTDSDEVIFDAMGISQQEAIPGIQGTSGPRTVRAHINWQSTVAESRQNLQRHALDMDPSTKPASDQLGADPVPLSRRHSLIVVRSIPDPDDNSGAVLETQTGDMVTADSCVSEKYVLTLCCQVRPQGVRLHMRFDSSIFQEQAAQRTLGHLEHILRLICLPANGSRKLSELDLISPQDLDEIWSWNAKVPAPIHRTVHGVVADTTARQPDAPAICAWDGHLTYAELDQTSTRLARCIINLGVAPGAIVPLCFEKSVWTPVAMLAVMKAGAASVALDLTNPLPRLKTIVAKYDRKVILCSRKNEATANSLDFSSVFIVDADNIPPLVASPAELPQVSPSQTLFITYTSGSTGTPKGACISHSNACTASHYQGYPLGFRTTSRVLDFAPYSFDVAWSNVIHTLCAGGCLCVASADEMMDDINETLSRFRVNLVNITPSALRAFTPDGSPLRDILLSGERPNSTVLSHWMDGPCIKNTYGPAECTFKSAFSTVSAKNLHSPDIGRPLGVCGWIACPERDDQLALIGQVGELLIEGPLVGQGYLADAGSASASFIEDPPWLLRGAPGVLGRRGRLYKTGDLMRYKADGTLQFIERKDSQVKIRGQRVELGEVEHHVQSHLATKAAAPYPPFAAELITPRASQNAMLVVFLTVSRSQGNQSKETSLQGLTEGLNEKLAQVLPGYMIPSAYVPLDKLPMTGTGKINRRELRSMGATLSLQQLLTGG